MKLTDLQLDRFLYKQFLQNIETKDSTYNSVNNVPAVVPPLVSGGAAQDLNISNVFINGGQIIPGTLVLTVGDWGWGQTSVFTSTNLNTVSWGTGTFKTANGDIYSISAGNTGVMSAKTYIYFDLNVSTTAYQHTTVPEDAVGIGKVLIAVAQNGAVTATFNTTEATQITGDNILANSIDVSKLVTGQLIVGTNVGQGTAVTSSNVTTIIGNTVTTGFINALDITALGTVTAGTLVGLNTHGIGASGLSPAMDFYSSLTDYNNGLVGGEVYVFNAGGTDRFMVISGESLGLVLSSGGTTQISLQNTNIQVTGNTDFLTSISTPSINLNGTTRTSWPTGGAQTPWTSDIAAAGYKLTGLGKFQLPVGTNLY